MPDILPGFAYARESRRYRDLSTGRYVASRDIVGLLDTQVQSLERRLGNMTQAFHEGNLAPAWWAEQMRTELRRAHLQNRALAAGGWHQLSAADYGSAGRKLRDDYARIANLAQGIADGTVTLPQALNRINGYAGSARLEFWEAQRQRAKPSDSDHALLERRVLSASEHCNGCIELYGRGWQPAGTLPLPGDGSTECGTHDRCNLISREVLVGDVGGWLGSKR